ncbi:MAG: cytochrome c4 [Thiomargarita sp.]|nr:cytochrome c4 [Thiomargarita sp.]
MKKITLAFCILTSSSTFVMANDIIGDIEAGKMKSAICMACHGVDGNSINPLWPKLAGQHVSYIVQQIKAFQSNDRNDPIMTGMAMPLTPEDMYNLAAYYSSLPSTTETVSDEFVTLGQKIYRGGNKKSGLPACIACHGANGKGNPAAKYPAISGQHAAYSKKQLMDYKSKVRKPVGNAAIMHDVAFKMSDAEMNAVTHYMQGLH